MKFNQSYSCFFYSIMIEMELHIYAEINKLNEFINDKKITSTFAKYDDYDGFLISTNKLKYLLFVLGLTYEHPEIEIYLKELLQKFTVKELNNSNANRHSVLHYMMHQSLKISLNSFEMILNFGIDVNNQTIYKNTPLHLAKYISGYMASIITLFVKYGADLNILNHDNRSVLDVITYHCTLNEDAKIIIMTLIDFGAKLNDPDICRSDDVLEFIELYRSSNIKPAIKN